MVAEREMKIFSLNSNRPLAEKIAQTVGIPLSNVGVNHFADGEIQIEINESVRAQMFMSFNLAHALLMKTSWN